MKLHEVLTAHPVARLIYEEADSLYTLLASKTAEGAVEILVRYGYAPDEYYFIHCPDLETAATRFSNSRAWHIPDRIFAPRDPYAGKSKRRISFASIAKKNPGTNLLALFSHAINSLSSR